MPNGDFKRARIIVNSPIIQYQLFSIAILLYFQTKPPKHSAIDLEIKWQRDLNLTELYYPKRMSKPSDEMDPIYF